MSRSMCTYARTSWVKLSQSQGSSVTKQTTSGTRKPYITSYVVSIPSWMLFFLCSCFVASIVIMHLSTGKHSFPLQASQSPSLHFTLSFHPVPSVPLLQPIPTHGYRRKLFLDLDSKQSCIVRSGVAGLIDSWVAMTSPLRHSRHVIISPRYVFNLDEYV